MNSEFEALLKRCTGLDSASVGSSAVERAVQERMRACKRPDRDAYWRLLQTSSSELQTLVDAVVVPETWFFRHREAFDLLVKIATDYWMQRTAAPALRILCLPCSTGEEPYSIVMALLDAGLPSSSFLVDAVDISGRALAQAGRATYGRNSFRGSDFRFRDAHFTPTAAGFLLSESVTCCVRFQRANLLDPAFLPRASRYDVVFCRNMLIYFDSPTQERAVRLLSKFLSDEGTLFVGPSEGNLLLEHGYVSVKAPLSFAFRRGTAAALGKSATPPPAPPWTAPAERPAPAPVYPADAAVRPLIRSPAVADVEPIRRLADRGHLADAARLCESYLRDHAGSADGQHLLGVIRDATGKHEEAAAHYRKALYLNPSHHEALVHLALLLERQGDASGARLLMNRASRLQQKQSA